jgi:hypothetical protein
MTHNRWPWFGSLVCAAAVFVGCHNSERSQPTGADPKVAIYKHLAKQTGQKEFAPGINLELPREVATLRSNAQTLEQRTTALRATLRALDGGEKRPELEREFQEAERGWETARAEVARKQQELSQQEDTYIRSVREQMKGVRDYAALYRLVGQQLTTADRLLAEPEVARQRMGLRMAREACGHVNSGAVDVWLAARICEAYFWPHLDIVETTPGSHERTLELLETSRRVFFDTYETNNVLKNYQLLLAHAPDARAADTFRVQVADWLEERGALKQAAEILNEIRDAQVLASAEERITRVRERAAGVP